MENNYDNDDIDDIRKELIKNIKNVTILLRNLKVIARVEPIHKYALVLGLKALINIDNQELILLYKILILF